VTRRVRYHKRFRGELAAQVSWLRKHRSPCDIRRLRVATASFSKRIAANPGIGYEVERQGVASYRVFHVSAGLPYLVWYVYGVMDLRGPVDLLMFLHVSQDRERFDAHWFD